MRLKIFKAEIPVHSDCLTLLVSFWRSFWVRKLGFRTSFKKTLQDSLSSLHSSIFFIMIQAEVIGKDLGPPPLPNPHFPSDLLISKDNKRGSSSRSRGLEMRMHTKHWVIFQSHQKLYNYGNPPLWVFMSTEIFKVSEELLPGTNRSTGG